MTTKYLELPAVNIFDKLSPKTASTILYDYLTPFCEKKGVCLSSYGNHNAPRSVLSVEEYHKSKTHLFNVKDVQRIFHYAETVFIPSEHYHNSYDLKHRLEVHPVYTKGKDKRYVTNGDTIAALLLKGFRAQYVYKNKRRVNLCFKVKIKPIPKYSNLSPLTYIRIPNCFGNNIRATVIHFFRRRCVKCHRVEEITHLLLDHKKRGKNIIVYQCVNCGVIWYYSTEDSPIDLTKGFQIMMLCDFNQK